MLGKIPNGVGYNALRTGWKAREITIDVGPALIFDRPLRRVKPFDAFGNRGFYRNRFLRDNKRTGEQRDKERRDKTHTKDTFHR